MMHPDIHSPFIPPSTVDVEVDAFGLLCPLPVIKASQALKSCPPGGIVRVVATDRGAPRDLEDWAIANGYRYLGTITESKTYSIYLQKPSQKGEETEI